MNGLKLDYRRAAPLSADPVYWGRVIDAMAVVLILLLFVGLTVFCFLFPLLLAVVQALEP